MYVNPGSCSTKPWQTAAHLRKISAWIQAHRLAGLLLLAAAVLLAGCTTERSTGALPRVGHGAEEYQQITGQARTAVLRAQRALDGVGVETNRCSPGEIAAFSREVEQLQVDSFRLRARAKAILARGDAYFEAWSQNPSLADSAQNQKVARDLPQLRQGFDKVKLASQQTGEAFRAFLSGLRTLRLELETDPGLVQTVGTKELIRTTHEHGSQVLRALNDISSELQGIIPLVARVRAEANP